MFGKYTDFQDEMENLDKFMDMLRVIYKRYTKIPMTKLNEILKHDIWFNSAEAVKFGLVDMVLEDNFEDIN
jgi:ATP-dependent protease ClpP protease subunit